MGLTLLIDYRSARWTIVAENAPDRGARMVVRLPAARPTANDRCRMSNQTTRRQTRSAPVDDLCSEVDALLARVQGLGFARCKAEDFLTHAAPLCASGGD
jgi:hypothetical protein